MGKVVSSQNEAEILHIGMGFQLAGYPQVIGTMWELQDGPAAEMAAAFYSHLAKLGKVGDAGSSARALHYATKEMMANRESGVEGNVLMAFAAYIHLRY